MLSSTVDVDGTDATVASADADGPRQHDAVSTPDCARQHDACSRIQRATRSRRVSNSSRLASAARLLAKLPTDLQEHIVDLAYESSACDVARLQASVSNIIAARLAKTGYSLGNALVPAVSWDTASLTHHFYELREAYLLATKYHRDLSIEVIGDFLTSAVYYITMCSWDKEGAWMRCQLAICGFTLAVLQRVPREQREAVGVENMELKSMIELTCIMIGA